MGEWGAWIGRTATQQDKLTPALLRRFCATLGIAGPREAAPQGIHWTLCTPEAATDELGIDGHPRRSGSKDSFFPPVPHPRRMWASSDVTFLRPIHRNAEIERTSTISAISEKEGDTGSLVFVDVDHNTSADGALAVRETQTLVYREAARTLKGEAGSTEAAPDPGTGNPCAPERLAQAGWEFHRTLIPSETLLFRYSAITFNTHRVHFDWPYATRVEGYEGLVVHGPLIASLLLDLVQAEFGDNCLKRFSFRASFPAVAGRPLTLVGRREGDRLTLAALNSAGRAVLSASGER